MAKVRYSDGRYPHGYRASHDTDVSATFKRVRREQEERAKAQAERDAAVEAEQARVLAKTRIRSGRS